MKLVTYLHQQSEHAGLLIANQVFPLSALHHSMPNTLQGVLDNWSVNYPLLQSITHAIQQDPTAVKSGIELSEVIIKAPIPQPPSCRDGYAFRQHVAAARRNRKVPMIPEFDQYPIFYFTNHRSIQGPGPVACMPDHFEKLDFELEVAIVICKRGRNIRAEKADEYIGGLMIMNDLSARRLQMEEMLLNLGPAKGKDFATTIGPWLVTTDELTMYETTPRPGHQGKNWNLRMRCEVNGQQVSEGNLADMDWTFAEIIERVSYGADIFPGDVIGSGTVGTGCFLELNGTGKLNDPHYPEQWLQPNDVVKMEVDALGCLENTMVEEASDFSILALKKNHAQL